MAATPETTKTARTSDRQALARVLLDEAGETYAHSAGIRLRDQPAPLFQLYVLANLLSTRIKAEIAVAAARELFAAGGNTARGMADLTWQQRVDALGRGHYVRYDESTSTRLGETADLVLERYGGDLRKLADEAQGSVQQLKKLLQQAKGMGPTGAAIFCREAQGVWPSLRPYADSLVTKGAQRVGLPEEPERLAELVKGDELPMLAAGLVRVARDQKLADRIVNRASGNGS